MTIPTVIKEEAIKLEQDAIVTLWQVDYTNYAGGDIQYFHESDINGNQTITYDGIDYAPISFEADGFEWRGNEQLPTPTLKFGNIGGAITALTEAFEDLRGATVTRIRTYAKHLSTPAGSDPDGTARFPDEVFIINRKVSENWIFIEFELASALDAEGVMLPLRTVASGLCPWKFKGLECGGNGSGNTAKTAGSSCGKTLQNCKDFHYNSGDAVPLPYGAFPGTLRLSYLQ